MTIYLPCSTEVRRSKSGAERCEGKLGVSWRTVTVPASVLAACRRCKVAQNVSREVIAAALSKPTEYKPPK